MGIRSKIFNLNTFCAYDLCGFLATHVLYSLLLTFFFQKILLYVDREQRSENGEGAKFCANIFHQIMISSRFIIRQEISFKEREERDEASLLSARTNNKQ